MGSPLQGDSAQIKSVADYATAVQGEYEGYLKAWLNIRDDLATHVQSRHLGDQVQNTMADAHGKGKKIVQTMEAILTELRRTGAEFSNINEQAAQQVRAQSLGNNGSIDTGTWQ